MVARSTHDGGYIVVRYRCPASAATDIPDEAMHQFRTAHWLRNELVACWKWEQAERERLQAKVPELALAETEFDAAAEAVAAAKVLVDEDKVERGSKRAAPDLAENLRNARRRKKAAGEARKGARAAARLLLKPELERVKDEYKAKLNAAHVESKTRGLLWHTADAVLNDHKVATGRVLELRKAGRPADLRFKRWEGEGRIRVTLMRSQLKHGCLATRVGPSCGMPSDKCPDAVPNQPPRTPALLRTDPNPWSNVVRLPDHMDPGVCLDKPPRRHGERETLSLRVGSGEQGPIWWHLPLFVHRPLPVEADIPHIEVVRRRVAGQWRLSVSVSVRVPRASTRANGDILGVDIGWRSTERGLRVAVVAATGPLPPVPAELQEVVHAFDQPNAFEIVVPQVWLPAFERPDQLRSIRDRMLDEIKKEVIHALKEDPIDGIQHTAADVAHWRSQGRMAVLARQWPATHPLAAQLEAWRKQDRHLWEWEAHGRRQIIARRDDAWKKVAAWLLSGDVSHVVMETAFVASVSPKPLPEDGDDHQAQRARFQRKTAAPASFAAALRVAAKARGVQVEEVDPAGTTDTHTPCGNEVEVDRSMTLWCPHCQVAFDRDLNAAQQMIARTASDPRSNGGFPR